MNWYECLKCNKLHPENHKHFQHTHSDEEFDKAMSEI